MTRGRRPTTGLQERAWLQRHRELLARDAKRPAQRELSPEWRQHFEDLRDLPRLKLSMAKARDREVWSWIYHLLVRQGQGAPYDLMTCPLGTNPWKLPAGSKPSNKSLCYLMDTVAQEYPLRDGETDLDRARRLYEAIRQWRKDRQHLTR